MGQYTDPAQGNLIVGGKEYTNAVNYRRDEIRATLSQYFDLGKTGHQVKVGGGYEVGEEELLRTVNGWGILASLTVSGQPRIRARYYPNQPAQRRARARPIRSSRRTPSTSGRGSPSTRACCSTATSSSRTSGRTRTRS